MPVPKGVWGIDIGQCALKALRLELIDGKPTATAFDYVEHPKILSQPDADPDQLIREALEKFLSRNQVKTDEVAIGIAGQSGLARFVKLPPVEEKKIGDIVKFEAKQQIPFPLDEVVWDYQKIAGGSVTDGFAMETEIGLFAMKRDVISRYLGYFSAVRAEVHVVQMSPLALVNFTTYEVLKKGGTAPAAPDEAPAEEAPRGKKRCVVVLDIGTDGSNLIITDGEKIIWQRPIPLGGNNFTRALTKDLKLTFAKAEHLKRNAAKSPELPNILKALKPVLTDFVGEVQRSLGYFTNTHRDAHVAYMVGLGSAFRLPGLQKYLSEKLQLEVKKPARFTRLSGDAVLNDPLFQENLLTFPIAYGLALQGLGEARLTTNLLPNEIRVDRMIRAKKPFAVAAAAALLLGTGALALGYSAELAAVTDKKIEAALSTSKSAASAYGTQESKFTQKQEELKKFQDELKAINAGQDERLNWPRFIEVTAAAMPRPGPNGNLNADPDQVRLWKGEGDAGLRAIEWFEKRMREGVKIEQAAEDDRSAHPQNLARVEIEAIYPRWVENIGQFLQRADDTVSFTYKADIADSMKPDEIEKDEAKGGRLKPKAVEGQGWVVEIRGYTYHQGAEQFVRRALIRNLQRMDEFARDESKVSEYLAGVPDPVKGKVSHVFLYKVWTDEQYPNTVVNVAHSYLDQLLGGGQAGFGGPGGPGGPSGPSAPGRGGPGPGGPPGPGEGGEGIPGAAAGQLAPPWQPLTGSGAGGGFFGGGEEGGPGPRGPAGPGGPGPRGPSGPGVPPPGRIAPPGVTGSGPGPGGPAGPSGPGVGPGPGAGYGGFPPTTPLAGKDDPPRRRHEFVVMLIWREPTPSGGGTPAPVNPNAGQTFGPGGPGS